MMLTVFQSVFLLTFLIHHVQAVGTLLGCYAGSSIGTLVNKGVSIYQSSLSCSTSCEGYAYMAMTNSNECYCFSSAPSGSDTSGCSLSCVGWSGDMCGGPSLYSVYQLGDASDSSSSQSSDASQDASTSPSTSSSTSASNSGTSTDNSDTTASTTTPSSLPSAATNSPTTSTTDTGSQTTTTSSPTTTGDATTGASSDDNGTTVTHTSTAVASPSTSASSSASDSLYGDSTSKKSSNTGAIAGGVVGGVVGIAAIAGLIFFFIRRNRDDDEEEDEFKFDKKSNGMVMRPMSNPFASPLDVPAGGYQNTNGNRNTNQFNKDEFSDPRLNPIMLGRRRISEGSLADEADYSRKILKVANPEDD